MNRGPTLLLGSYCSSDFGSAAHIDNIGEFNGPAVALHAFSDTPGYYTATESGARGIRYDGPGACAAQPPVAVPNLIGLSPPAAQNTIKLAGAESRVVSSLIQPDCARFDQVISQDPAPRPAAHGSLVNFEYSSGPRLCNRVMPERADSPRGKL